MTTTTWTDIIFEDSNFASRKRVIYGSFAMYSQELILWDIREKEKKKKHYCNTIYGRCMD